MAATLLLADDSPAVQKIMQLTFADRGIRVVSVGDGESALARLEEDAPDIVVAAVGIRGRNGYEIASRIKQDPKLSHIPVLLMTGAFEPIDEAKAADAKCDGVLIKPLEPPAVVARVMALLGHSEPAAIGAGASEAGVIRQRQPDRQPTPASPVPVKAPHPLDDYLAKLDAAFAQFSTEPAGASSSDEKGEGSGGFGGVVTFSSTEDELPSFLAPSRQSDGAATSGPQLALPPASSSSAIDEQPAGAPAVSSTTTGPESHPAEADALVDRVTRRVLERLSDQVVRETAQSIVPAIAERVVREELDRIKTAIRHL